MFAAQIAAALNPVRRSGQWWRCICPVHGSRAERSATLALRDGNRGLITVCHAGCSTADLLGELRQRRLIDGGSDWPSATAPVMHHPDREGRIQIAEVGAALLASRGSRQSASNAGPG